MARQHEAQTDRQVSDAARAYRRRGYRVLVSPGRPQLPEFLADFRPALIAERDDEHVVVEVRTRQTMRGANDLVELAQRIERQKGWRLDLVVANPARPDDPLRARADALGRILREAATAYRAGAGRAGFLLVFSFAESLLLDYAKRFGRRAADRSFASVLHDLTVRGVIDRPVFEDWSRLADLRSVALAADEDVSAPGLDDLVPALERLCDALLPDRP